jgi:hypothetical protein
METADMGDGVAKKELTQREDPELFILKEAVRQAVVYVGDGKVRIAAKELLKTLADAAR